MAYPAPAAALEKAPKAAPGVARATAKRELDAFERKAKAANPADTEPAQALEGAERRLKVVEATKLESVTSWAELEDNRRLLLEAKALLELAKLRKHEHEAIDFVATRERPLEGVKQRLVAARAASAAVTALLAQQARDAGKDPEKLAATKRAKLVGKRAKDTLSYLESELVKTRAVLQKMLARTKLGALAAYPQRVAQAAKEDTAINTRLVAVGEQLKELEALASASGARCDLSTVDWKNFTYSFGKLTKGKGPRMDKSSDHRTFGRGLMT